MKITTWNVNSLNVRLPHVLEYLQAEQPDILALQETKMADDKFPAAAIEETGYHLSYSGQKTYNGVAIISKSPCNNVITDIPGFDDPQRRLLAATVDGVRIINVYIPNGQEVGSEKYAYKFQWLRGFYAFLKQQMQQYEKLIVLGDFNVAPADTDIHDPKRWHEKIMCSTPEREMFHAMLGLGLTDSIRALHPQAPMFSWWDYRLNAYQRGWGIRIDHLLTTPSLALKAGGVDDARYRNRERPSDHAPVWLEVN